MTSISELRLVRVVCVVGLFVAACAPQLSQRVEEARAALEIARAAEAPTRSPDQFQAAERAIKESESLMWGPFSPPEAEYQAALGKAMAVCAAATAKMRIEVERAQAEAQASRAQADRFQAQARAELARLQAQLRATEEAALTARSRAERAEAQVADLTRQAAPPTAPAPATYTRYVVKPGDTLERIAARPEIYGDAKQWQRLYEANRDIIGRDRKLKTGQVLMVPKP